MLQQTGEFLLEILLEMMPCLILDIFLHHSDLGRADAECSIPFLPGKAPPHPSGGAALELLNGVSEGLLGRQNKQQVNVVRSSTGGEQRETFAPGDAAKMSIEPGLARDSDERAAVFGAKDTVDEIACVCVGHATVVPTGLQFYMGLAFPTLKRGANEHCAYGAVVWLPGELEVPRLGTSERSSEMPWHAN